MPNIPAKNEIMDVFKVGVGAGAIGLGATLPGILGVVGTVAAGYLDNKYIVKGEAGKFLWYFSIINAADILMESMAGGRGVIG